MSIMNIKTLYKYELSNAGELIKNEISVNLVDADVIFMDDSNYDIVSISIKSLNKCIGGVVYMSSNDDNKAAKLLEDYHIEQCESSMKIHKKHLNILLNYYQAHK